VITYKNGNEWVRDSVATTGKAEKIELISNREK
jgi:hypothetical protein